MGTRRIISTVALITLASVAQADLTIAEGETVTMNSDYTNTGTLTNYGTLNSYGTLNNTGTVNNEYWVRILNAAFINSGTFYNNSSLLVYGEATNTGRLVNNGVLSACNSQTYGGEISGSGLFHIMGNAIDAVVTFQGTLSAGDGLGALRLDGGAYALDAENILLAEIGGTEQGIDYDWLHLEPNPAGFAASSLSIDGTLDVDFYEGFDTSTLLGGEIFDIITADGLWLSGSFSSLDLADAVLADGLYWGLSYGYQENGVFTSVSGLSGENYSTVRLTVLGELTVVPEPATLTLISLGLAGLLCRRRRQTS